MIAYFRSEIPNQRRKDLKTNNIETLCIEVRFGKVKWLIANCYRNPPVKDEDFETYLTPFLDGLTS